MCRLAPSAFSVKLKLYVPRSGANCDRNWIHRDHFEQRADRADLPDQHPADPDHPMHKGQGGGLSDMFGGGISSSAGSSGVAERNLNRITMGTLLIWLVCIIGYALLVKFAG